MTKLFWVDFHSVIRSKRFWAGSALMAAMAVIAGIDRQQMARNGWEIAADGGILEFAVTLFMLLPALGGLFIHTDYHDGTIRNKLTVGRSRAAVYLSNLATVYWVGIFYSILYMGAFLLAAQGLPVNDPQGIVRKYLMLLLVFLAQSAISVFLAAMITNRSVLVLSVLVGACLVFVGQVINGQLQNPEMIDDYDDAVMITQADGTVLQQFLDKDGNVIDPKDIPQVPNPRYIREPMRTVLRTFNNIQPGGQLNEILSGGHQEYIAETQEMGMVQTPYWQLALYSLGVTLAFTWTGLLLFRRKDLK